MDVKEFEELVSVASGKVIALTDVRDALFSQELMGKGIAVEPLEGKVYAPFDGKVISVFPTKHAISLLSDKGCEILIHIGIDTVQLQGKYFEEQVKEGDIVKQGDLLMSVDKSILEEKGFDTVIPVVILNTSDYEKIEVHSLGETVVAGQLVLGLEKKVANQIPEKVEVQVGKNQLERAIISALGGPDNIRTIGHCATRLRITFIDDKKVDREALNHIKGVMGVVEAMGGLQIVIGNAVNNVFDNIQNLYHFKNKVSDGEESKARGNIASRILNVLADVLSAITPLIMGSGLLSAALILLARLGVSEMHSTYRVLEYAANVVFYFLPVFLAYECAKRFKTSVIYSLFIAGLLLHPTFVSMVAEGASISLFGLPVTAIDYGSTLLPIILSVWILSYVEKFVDRYLPKSLRYVIKPLVIIMVMIPITLIITGPAGYLMGEGLGWLITAIRGQAEWLAILILCAIAPFMVMTGMHVALTPILILTNLENLGYENMMLVAFIGMNFSQFAVAMATFFKTKNKTLKSLALSCGITAFFGGVTEPTLYGISVKMKRPLYATFIGCIANAICCIIFQIKIFSFAPPSFFTLPIFMNPDGTSGNFISAIITIIVVIVVTFVATWMLGFDDSVYDD